MFALGFNLLWWLGRSTFGQWSLRHHGEALGLVASALGPMALLALAAYLVPARRTALVTVASASLGLSAMLGGA